MNAKDVVFIALMTAITAALGFFPAIQVPVINVPIVGQNMGAMLAGGLLGAKRGALSQALFVLLVAVGLPLLTGGRGGLAVLMGNTGGYIFGWIAAAGFIGWMVERHWPRLNVIHVVLALIIGSMFIDYAAGIAWIVIGYDGPLMATIAGHSAFLPGAAVKMAVATVIILAMKRYYPLIRQ